MTARKKGAQPGNLNAIKHGLYSKQLRAMRAVDPDALSAEGLENEIVMLRTLISRTLELSGGLENINDAVKLIGALSIATGRLSAMLKVQKSLTGGQQDEITQALDQALSEVIKELGIS